MDDGETRTGATVKEGAIDTQQFGPCSLGRCIGIVLTAALALAGCASGPAYPPAPLTVNAPDQPYTIGPLDTLSIVVWRNPEVSTTVSVRPDGFISAPLVADTVAAGRTPADLSRELEKSLAKYIRDPVVTVVVQKFEGLYSQQVRIVGEAAKPQAVAYRQNMTMLDVMIQVGGMTDFANGNGAVLIRGAEGGKQYSLRLRDLLGRGDISANVAVMPGDIILIPQSWF
jgi:polysaccharide export outer membrane protein